MEDEEKTWQGKRATERGRIENVKEKLGESLEMRRDPKTRKQTRRLSEGMEGGTKRRRG